MAAATPPACVGPAQLLTADGKGAQPHRPPTVNGQAEKRAAPESGSKSPHKAKKQRVSSDPKGSQVGLEVGHEAKTLVQPETVGLSSMQNHPTPCRVVPEQNQPRPRRVVPEQVSPVPNPRPAGVHSKRNPIHEVASRGMVHAVQHRMGTSGCNGLGQGSPAASSWQQPRRHNSPTSSSLIAAAVLGEEAEGGSQAEDSSNDGSEQGSEGGSKEASQLEAGVSEGSEKGSEGAQPAKLLGEFGTAGDAWWQDFIAAKEKMLNDVLQAIP